MKPNHLNENPLNVSRRDALRLLASAATSTVGVVTALAATTEGAAAQTGILSPPSLAPPSLAPPSLGGELRFDQKTLAAAADDFGHIVRQTPEGVLLPASDEDVAATIRWANELGHKVAA